MQNDSESQVDTTDAAGADGDAPAFPMSEIREYNETEVALADFRLRYHNLVFNVATTAGMADAKAARMFLRTQRTGLEKRRKQLKEDILARGRLIDGEAKRITGEIVSLEDPIDAQIRVEEERKEQARMEKARIEAERVQAIHDKIDAIRNHGATVQTELDELTVLLDRAKAINVTQDEYQEFAPLAALTRDNAIAQLQALADARRTFEQQRAEQEAERKRQAEEAERIAAERAELARRTAELEAREQAQREVENTKPAVVEAPTVVGTPVALDVETVAADPSDDLPWGQADAEPQPAIVPTEEVAGLALIPAPTEQLTAWIQAVRNLADEYRDLCEAHGVPKGKAYDEARAMLEVQP